MTHRQNNVFTAASDGDMQASGGSVTAYAPGGIVKTTSTGNQVTLYGGHGITAGVKVMRGIDTATFSGVLTVLSVAGNVLTMSGNYPVDAGDRLVNLGGDTSSINPPNYDGSSLTIYQAGDTTATTYTNETVSLDESGGYEYWHTGVAIWELIRNGVGTLVAIVMNAAQQTFLPLDLDHDGVNELEPYAAPFAQNRYWLYGYKAYDASTLTTNDRVQNAILFTQRWTGNSALTSHNRNGIFAINQFGDPTLGTGGGTVSGPSIPIGGYSEHYGNGTWAASNGAFLGGELAATLYGPTTMNGTMFGGLCIAQIANGSLGGTATVNEFIGVRGNAQITSGTSVITTAIGVDGVITKAAASTITNAYALRANFATPSGTGAITNAYGLRVDAITAGGTNNYGIYVGGASGGATTNEALYVASGKTTFADTTAFCIIKTNNTYLGDGTDRDTILNFDTSTSDGAITYKGGSATNVFEFNKPFRQISPATAIFTVAYAEENLTLSTSGTTTDTTANLLPANAMILAVSARITTTIATATDWKLGDATQAARFTAANPTLTSGTTSVGMLHLDPTVATANLGPVQTSAAKVRVTTTGTPSAGAIRITVAYLSFSAATS